MMAAKFGLFTPREGDSELIAEGLSLLQVAEMDMTLFFRGLAQVDPAGPDPESLRPAFYREDTLLQHGPALQDWLRRHGQRAQAEDLTREARIERMNAVNPRYVLRNYLAQEAIDLAEQGDLSRVRELLHVLRRPYAEQPEYLRYTARRPDWAREKPGCSMLSCSS
jgi:uncharacterized protein YdiU (UPF0061 family)